MGDASLMLDSLCLAQKRPNSLCDINMGAAVLITFKWNFYEVFVSAVTGII